MTPDEVVVSGGRPAGAGRLIDATASSFLRVATVLINPGAPASAVRPALQAEPRAAVAPLPTTPGRSAGPAGRAVPASNPRRPGRAWADRSRSAALRATTPPAAPRPRRGARGRSARRTSRAVPAAST